MMIQHEGQKMRLEDFVRFHTSNEDDFDLNMHRIRDALGAVNKWRSVKIPVYDEGDIEYYNLEVVE